MRTAGFGFSRVHVLASLRTDDLPFGRFLYEYLNELPGVQGHVDYVELATKPELFEAIEHVIRRVQATGDIPLLHIEAHGDSDGLELRSGAFVRWPELREPLSRLNTLTRLQLMVCISACSGIHLWKIIDPTERAPVWGVLGPEKDLTGYPLLKGFRAFYKELFSSGDAAKALEAMRLTDGNSATALVPVQYLFSIAYRHYLSELCSGTGLAERVDRLAQTGMNPVAIELILKHPESRFEQDRFKFFMCDLFPEHKEKFKITMDDVRSAPPAR